MKINMCFVSNKKYTMDYICKKCSEYFSVLDKDLFTAWYKSWHDPNAANFEEMYDEYLKERLKDMSESHSESLEVLEDFIRKNPYKETPEKCPSCNASKENFLKENKDFSYLKIFECGDCKEKFAVGVHSNFMHRYGKNKLTYEQAFEEFHNELKNFGATIPHFKKKLAECPKCRSSSIKECKIGYRNMHQWNYLCRRCKKSFSVGVTGKDEDLFYKLGMDFEHGFRFYTWMNQLMDKYYGTERIYLTSDPEKCPYCGIDKKEFREISRSI